MDLVHQIDTKGKVSTKMNNKWHMILKVNILQDLYIKQEERIPSDITGYSK